MTKANDNHLKTQAGERKRSLLVLAILVLVLGVGGALAGAIYQNSRHTAETTLTQTAAQKTAQPSTATSNSTQSTASGTAGANSPTNKPSASSAPTNAACKLLTLSAAQQVLGSGTRAAAPGNHAAIKTGDTTVDTCAYASNGKSAELVVRMPKDSLGVSENATVFGSERPQGAIAVSGYGQTAYWDPASAHLNVLGSNSWYIITTTDGGKPGSQSDAEAVAKLLAPGF